MMETVYALIGVIVAAFVAYLLIGWLKGRKSQTSVDNIKPRGDDTN